jgi:hypothetical protein
MQQKECRRISQNEPYSLASSRDNTAINEPPNCRRMYIVHNCIDDFINSFLCSTKVIAMVRLT